MPLFWKRKPLSLTVEHRRALRLLASAADGRPEALLLAHGLTATLLAELQASKPATISVHPTRAGGRAIMVRRLWITDAGRQALLLCATVVGSPRFSGQSR